MDTNNNLHLMIGRIEGRMDAQDARHEEMREAIIQNNAKLDAIVGALAHQKGADSARRRVAGFISGAVSLVISAAGVAVAWATSKHG